MSDFFSDFLDGVEPDLIDLNLNDIPDVHEMEFISTGGVVPDAVDGALDLDADGVPDHEDGHRPLDGGPFDSGTYVDIGGDGIDDFADPFIELNGDGLPLEPVLRHQVQIEHFNPFFRNR